MLLAPLNAAPDVPRALVVYHHGAGELAESLLRDPLKSEIVRAILSQGWMLASADAHGDNWGNAASTKDYAELSDAIAAHRRVSSTLVLSQSMGGLSGLEYVATHPNVKGWAGIYPACSIEAMRASPQWTAEVESAHSNDDAASLDPISVEPGRYSGLRMRFYASHQDTAVIRRTNSDAFAARVKGQAIECEVVDCTGEHGDPSHFRTDDLISFFRRCLK
jgi:pimeloyl-ACP methyl ester carboxylesterase